ncbi:hypothetical protein FJV41_08020 [Myxococcus llanfairpwllgwyngyllgogerychwyrndrobwllllantysiliogogogochensis]|uniref:Uncharacterized protein n=1 Tax=Myxococcus llanfairpwllgwyngyllgogerychwyrndrobwllllantysiliogogogochensis TaxID=2590453 RepID=A0A540X750_9BACT|nr:hypothetical protein [Myxococcus llanfairpwllgwyngyllgogerychwyrndrobwllllantysiliogogogochensis]TQF16534.1 hypothetical protein FJV41_08020 [Myxococcus llanfairpwllgwyngyllgogerychwyrndrobwllllantysiliogogogochensis]
MSTEDEGRPPPLPDEVRAALEALRGEKPSPHLRARLQAALIRAEHSRGREPTQSPSPRALSHHPAARVLVGAALAGAVALLLLARGDESGPLSPELLPAREVAFRLPGDGAGWLELPWAHGVHSGEPATVWLETPPPLDFHPRLRDAPSLAKVDCDEARCVHEFTARTGAAATPLRVRIDKPGRYEFRVSHASDVRHVQEHFVVVADQAGPP